MLYSVTVIVIILFFRMRPYLFDPSGRSLSIKNTKKDGSIMWRCTVRPKRNPCPGIAWQQGSVYVTIRDHTCGKNQHKKLNKKITGETKKRCRDNKFASARTIAEKLILNAVKNISRMNFKNNYQENKLVRRSHNRFHFKSSYSCTLGQIGWETS